MDKLWSHGGDMHSMEVICFGPHGGESSLLTRWEPKEGACPVFMWGTLESPGEVNEGGLCGSGDLGWPGVLLTKAPGPRVVLI